MRIPRFYQAVALRAHQRVELDERVVHHLHVLRLTVGSSIAIFNGEGEEYSAIIRHISKHHAEVELQEPMTKKTESPIVIHLGQGISRGDKMDWVLQKAVELGVNSITPLLTERCGVKLSSERWEKRRQHWQQVVISACEQSGRNHLPVLQSPLNIATWLENSEADLRLALDPKATERLSHVSGSPTSISLLIGPEGGLSDDEIAYAKQRGFIGLQLGPRILRTETAPLAALTAIQCRFGDMS